MSRDPRDRCYFARMRANLPPAEIIDPQEIPASTPAPADPEPGSRVGEEPATPGEEPIPVGELAPEFPKPRLPFWWFSSTPLPDRRISAGQPVEAAPGTRLPMEADYWCHEGDKEWAKVDRAARPKPDMKKRKPTHRQRGTP